MNHNNNNNNNSSNRPDEISQSLPVPEYKMGWIVGKRGSYINQLSKKSGAQITISDSTSKEYGTVWKYVQITGSGRAVDRAKKLLHIRLERLEPRGGESGETKDKDSQEDNNGPGCGEDKGSTTSEAVTSGDSVRTSKVSGSESATNNKER